MKTGSRLNRQLSFLAEIDKLKSVKRRTLLMDGSRRENDAEHAWHLAMIALILENISCVKRIDLLKVLKMALIHDLVEIDAGDVFFYDERSRDEHKKLEVKAAKRIFGLLPRDQSREFAALWNEFEARKTPEARFVAALDRFQPIFHNYKTGGRVWKRAAVTPEQVLTKNKHIEDGSPALWQKVRWLVEEARRRGFFKGSMTETKIRRSPKQPMGA